MHPSVGDWRVSRVYSDFSDGSEHNVLARILGSTPNVGLLDDASGIGIRAKLDVVFLGSESMRPPTFGVSFRHRSYIATNVVE